MAEPSDFRTDVDVFSSDGHKLGNLKGVVLRRADLRVTAVIVDIGFLRSGRHLWEGGLGLDYDRVVPIGDVESAGEDKVVLSIRAEHFKEAAQYTEDSFETPPDLIEHGPNLPERALTAVEHLSSGALNWMVEKQNRAVDEADIEEGTPVWRQEPHEKLGEVDRILVDESSGRVRAIVIRRGFLLKRDVVLPTRFITEFLDLAIHADISDEELEQLEEFSEA
jgi:uncharacterized protein YrrD